MFFIPALVFCDIFISLWIDKEMVFKQKNIGVLLAISGFLSTLFVSLPNNFAIGMGKIKQFTIYSTIRSIFLGIDVSSDKALWPYRSRYCPFNSKYCRFRFSFLRIEALYQSFYIFNVSTGLFTTIVNWITIMPSSHLVSRYNTDMDRVSGICCVL